MIINFSLAIFMHGMNINACDMKYINFVTKKVT